MEINDKVTWTHISRRGRAVTMTLKHGEVVAVADDTATVKTPKGTRTYQVAVSALRLVGQRSTLMEFCDTVFAANREANRT